jgi:Sec-independent protein translocase protein TatA
MNDFFGIGLPEFILIMIIAGIVMGPERIAKAARWLGKTSAQLQAISRGFVRQLNAELEAADQGGEIKGAVREMQELQRQVAELKGELRAVAQSAVREPRQALEAAHQEAQQTIRPPSFPALGQPAKGERPAVPAPSFPVFDEPANDETTNGVGASYPPPSLALPKRVEVAGDPD